jgi:hypothetical protein
MKKLLLLFLVMSACAYGFAEVLPNPPIPGLSESKGFKGKVDLIILSDSEVSQREVTVINDKGDKMKFYLTSGIGVYGSAWEVLSLKKLKPGDNVLVEYTTNKKGNVNRAISIMLE